MVVADPGQAIGVVVGERAVHRVRIGNARQTPGIVVGIRGAVTEPVGDRLELPQIGVGVGHRVAIGIVDLSKTIEIDSVGGVPSWFAHMVRRPVIARVKMQL